MQSPSHGAYVSPAVPIITKSHAPKKAFRLVVLDEQKDTKTDKKRKCVKRPLMLNVVLLAQGWTAGVATTKVKDIPEKAMLAALGKAMSFHVMKSLWGSLQPPLSALNQNDRCQCKVRFFVFC